MELKIEQFYVNEIKLDLWLKKNFWKKKYFFDKWIFYEKGRPCLENFCIFVFKKKLYQNQNSSRDPKYIQLGIFFFRVIFYLIKGKLKEISFFFLHKNNIRE